MRRNINVHPHRRNGCAYTLGTQVFIGVRSTFRRARRCALRQQRCATQSESAALYRSSTCNTRGDKGGRPPRGFFVGARTRLSEQRSIKFLRMPRMTLAVYLESTNWRGLTARLLKCEAASRTLRFLLKMRRYRLPLARRSSRLKIRRMKDKI